MPSRSNFLAPGADIRVEGAPDGPLRGRTFVAKDLFDVAGARTGAGNPDWARTHPMATKNAWAVQKLLDAGATLVGKTITDEISLGLLGENAHDGTPLNPRAPDRVPGGSSSGSASAVAQAFCDAALGTDTGGSVRVPASFCGLYGIRPTHGRLPLQGMAPQAPSSDTTGWFARDAATFLAVSQAMLDERPPTALPNELIVAVDAFGFADEAVRDALAPAVKRLGALLGSVREDLLAPQGLSVWGRAQRTLQMAEAWKTFQPWVEQENPRFAFLVARSLLAGSMVEKADLAWAALMRDEARGRLAHLLSGDAILCMPTTPSVAPLRGQPLPVLDRARDRINCLAAHGGLAGHPQLSLPLGEAEGAPVGLSIIGARGADMTLAAVAQALEDQR
ncbi:amidase [Pikeienuella piscinae]|uniref:Amidase n=1 Tax=Pikeienuella piscinae TaxID=2748098 RepID=A0A7L5BT90_9RHOB|nr:amidase [Pikeienuella piscinae]QIE55120.1 amidase [Pikeienuella piscinae]